MSKKFKLFSLFVVCAICAFFGAEIFTERLKQNGIELLIDNSVSAYKTKDFDQALLHLANAEELEPTRPVIYGLRAEIYIQQQKFLDAIEQSKKAIELGDSSSAIQLTSAKALIATNHSTEALQALQKANSLGEDSHQYYYLLGLANIDQKKGREALHALQTAWKKDKQLHEPIAQILENHAALFEPYASEFGVTPEMVQQPKKLQANTTFLVRR